MSTFFKKRAADVAASPPPPKAPRQADGSTDTDAGVGDVGDEAPRQAGGSTDALMALFKAVGLKALALMAHYMWAIPSAVLAGRVEMIATAVGADEGDVSTAVHIANLDPLDLEAGLASRPAIVCPDARCMNPSCSGGATNGTMVLSDSSGVVYGIGGRRGAHIFVFKCAGCEAVTGVSTVTLPGGSQLPRSDIAQAKYYVPNHKARQQHTGQTAFESKLLRSFLFDFATVKTMEGWCKTYNHTHGLARTDAALNLDVFRLHMERWAAMREVTSSPTCAMQTSHPTLRVTITTHAFNRGCGWASTWATWRSGRR